MNKEEKSTFGAYSPVYKAGNLYYISGQVGVVPATKLAPASISEQVKQAMENLANVIDEYGLNFKDIVKTTLYLKDIDDFNEVDLIYKSYFPAPRPARSTVAVKALPIVGGKNTILFEIEAIAYKEEKCKTQ